ncbi:MAG TPA: DUF4235 domain-containing protein [Pseudonocardia sp.]|jgi:hypothetical protein|uniref:DUF4235 domain-containing protein n=1 Tax=Pseudonocardia sp. TaxID=60912 RepID=UPI002B87706E|nr:DUF4235 domain-containing protein [Pseudonocardia sp.]HTF49299.1 DUF4235 domain-containing protein [Pseudonocardia sp.]
MKVLYKPLGFVLSVLGGILASAVFDKVWAKLSGEREMPPPTSARHSTRQVVTAAALQGAIFGAVKAMVDRAGAKGYRKLTGIDPGK